MFYSNLQILDFALDYLHNKFMSEHGFVSPDELKNNMQGADVKDIDLVCQKLFKDGFILYDNVTPFTDIKLSFDGKTFKESGGYQEQERIQKIKFEREELDRNFRIRNDLRLVLWTRNLFWGTVVVAIGAVGLVIWEIWHFYHSR